MLFKELTDQQKFEYCRENGILAAYDINPDGTIWYSFIIKDYAVEVTVKPSLEGEDQVLNLTFNDV